MEKDMNREMHDAMEGKFLPMFSIKSGVGLDVLPDVYCYTNQIVNIVIIGRDEGWVLVDTGMPESSKRILEVVEKNFGKGSRPRAIVLTHGHFDHVGAVIDLVKEWDVKVYAHEAELPYLIGEQSYPKPDGTVEGGLVAKISPLFPNEPVNLGHYVEALPADGSVPYIPEWKWLHTPGHTPGHVSLFREKDRTLIAGDAFVTVKQESLYKVITQEIEVNGPPRYLTTDWPAAKKSVEKLAALRPEIAVTGHGQPLSGTALLEGLKNLVEEFDDIAIPDYGKFIDRKNMH